jgi:ribosomal protein S6--L-glutamate ligase
MRIAFLLQRSRPERPGASLSAVTTEIIESLRARGAHVELLVPEDQPLDCADLAGEPRHDVYVLKAKTALTLGIAGAMAAAGARVVNTFEASSLTRDKLASTAVLAGFGVPVPPSFATGEAHLLRRLLAGGPLWLKPPRGSQGAGVQRLASAADLAASNALTVDAHALPVPLFAQAEVPSGGFDLKVYVVGEQMWAIRRPFPARSLAEKLGTPARVSPPIRDAALACGQALGLELYGVDFLVAGDEFFVVDVNAFPGYKGIPEAPAAIADYLSSSGAVA